MRQGPNSGRRPRSRHHGGSDRGNDRNGNGNGNGGGNLSGGNRPRSAASLKHQSFDSNCGDLRVRGNAWQVYEKYQALARDATSGGDRVTAENYLQHAEHYFRVIEAINEATAAEQRARGEPVTAFSGQPEIPPSYYPLAGGPARASGGDPNNAAGQPATPPQAEAVVQQRTPPSASPFFTQEEIDEQNGEQPPLALAR
ncbi:MAG: DUF4167 domain-containing protein [Alphaproteobacteria bacterium]|nr:DUF4167 domain-containing protein [Alphaproteobacteria bacterium]